MVLLWLLFGPDAHESPYETVLRLHHAARSTPITSGPLLWPSKIRKGMGSSALLASSLMMVILRWSMCATSVMVR